MRYWYGSANYVVIDGTCRHVMQTRLGGIMSIPYVNIHALLYLASFVKFVLSPTCTGSRRYARYIIHKMPCYRRENRAMLIEV